MQALKTGLQWLLLIFVVGGLSCVYYFHWYEFLSFSALKQHHEALHLWANQHYVWAVISYMLLYIVAVALSVPGSVFITLAGGLLFGPIAIVYVIISATLGASSLFLIVSTTLGTWIKSQASGWVKKLKKGFEENAFSYLLFLRLVPVFPFWVINIVPALLEVKLKIFVIATFLGIIPGVIVYVMIGNSLNTLFKTNELPNLNIIFAPSIFLPLLGLAILAILPVVYKHWKEKKPGKHING